MRPDAWRVLSRLPFSTLYGIEAPGSADQHPYFREINEYALQRVPTAKRQQDFHTSRSINHVAALIAATGEQLPDELACRVCSNPRAGQWQGCVIPGSPDFVELYRFGCANCFYHGNRSHCKLDPNFESNLNPDP